MQKGPPSQSEVIYQTQPDTNNKDFTRSAKSQEQNKPQQQQQPSFFSRFFKKLCCVKTNSNKKNTQLSIEASQSFLLPPIQQIYQDRITLVLDLDETLVHSSFEVTKNPDYVFPIFLDGSYHNVYVLKRPFADEFLQKTCQLFEVVLFTASIEKYAGPLMEKLDDSKKVAHKLFRDNCTFHQQMYVKDLKKLNRDIKKIIIVDNSPNSYLFHPENAIPVSS